MTIYDINGNVIKGTPDMTNGYLVKETITIHHPETTEEEMVMTEPEVDKNNGGIPKMPEMTTKTTTIPAWDEEREEYVYHANEEVNKNGNHQ